MCGGGGGGRGRERGTKLAPYASTENNIIIL